MNPTCSCAHKFECWLGDVCPTRNKNEGEAPGCFRKREEVKNAGAVEVYPFRIGGGATNRRSSDSGPLLFDTAL